MLSQKEYAKDEVLWSEPIEQSWQVMSSFSPRPSITKALSPKMPHLSLPDIFFISAVMNLENRPYGAVTWLAGYYGISRPSAYALPKRVVNKLLPRPEELPIPEKIEEKAEISINRINGTILTALFPGNSSIRATQKILDEAFDTPKSVGYISKLRSEAGLKAGEILSADNEMCQPLWVFVSKGLFSSMFSPKTLGFLLVK